MKVNQFIKSNAVNLIIGIFLIVTYIFGLLVPVTSDAGKYAAISRVIYETGDWINLQIHFEPYLQKPPLLFWITTPFYFIFGPTAFSFKLPVLLYSLIAVYSTYRFAQIYYAKKTAVLASVLLATSEFYFLFHNDIHTDCLLTANVIFSVWQFALYFQTKKTIPAILGGVGVGLAMISKGPIGIFVPAMAFLSHLLYTRKFDRLLNFRIILSGISVSLILFVGLKGIFNQFSWEGIQFFFWDNNAGRISGDLKGNSNDYFFYFHTALYIFLPWGFLFFIAAFFETKNLLKMKNQELFSLGGIFFYWIVISVARAKAPHYFMVLSPFMAVISANWLYNFYTNKKFITIWKAISVVQYATIFFAWALLLLLCTYFFPSNSVFFWIVMLIMAGLNFIVKKQNSFNKIIQRSVIAVIAINFALNVHLFPQFFTYQSVIPACEVFNRQAKENEMLNTYLSEHRELFFYAKNPGHFFYTSDDLKKGLSKNGDWIYTNDEGLQEIKQTQAEILIVKSFKHRSLSKLTPGFINPKTRASRLSNMHLIKIVSPL